METATVMDPEGCYRAVRSRDRRFDGIFYSAVSTTGIYCRPSCPASTPKRHNVAFYRTAAAAQSAGFRACKRCLPDATPGSPEWDVAADVAGRAMRLVGDGVVEREGVGGLAGRLGYSSRQLNRLLTAQLGAGPLALARARRAQSARVLVETTTMPFADVACAAGFASIRQFNETVREVYDATPTQLRQRAAGRAANRSATPITGTTTGTTTGVGIGVGIGVGTGVTTGAGSVEVRLAVRRPFDAAHLHRFLVVHAASGVEEHGPGWYARTLRLPHGPGVARLHLSGAAERGYVPCLLRLHDLRDLGPAVERCRRLVDADCDPVAVDEQLGADPWLRDLVARRSGLRVPGHVDGDELAVRTVLGQQVTLAHAVRLTGLLVDRFGETVEGTTPARLFPSTATLAAVDPAELPMPRARARALVTLCAALADGDVVLDRSADRAEVRSALLALPGIGPWTADYVAMRALADPDVWMAGDVALRRAARAHGIPDEQQVVHAGAWRPWRSYAQLHLWSTLDVLDATGTPTGARTPCTPVPGMEEND